MEIAESSVTAYARTMQARERGLTTRVEGGTGVQTCLDLLGAGYVRVLGMSCYYFMTTPENAAALPALLASCGFRVPGSSTNHEFITHDFKPKPGPSERRRKPKPKPGER